MHRLTKPISWRLRNTLSFGVWLALLAGVPPLRAVEPLGTLVGTYAYSPSKLLADPVRSRVYVADAKSNSVVVIDTTSLQVIATIVTALNPADLAISPDGTVLYVANRGSSVAAIAVVDLDTLAVRASYPLEYAAHAVAAGLGGRVYAAIENSTGATRIVQFDGPTGTVQTNFNGSHQFDLNEFLQISPDGDTLFEAGTGGLVSFDVSTASPTEQQTNSNLGENLLQLVISHNGSYLCAPAAAGNPGASPYAADLFSTANINSYSGSFNDDDSGQFAFSPDDSLLYQAQTEGAGELSAFSTQTFLQLAQSTLPTLATNDGTSVTSVVADNTGSYLFIGESSDYETTTYGLDTEGQLVVVTTGAGTLSPSPPLITSAGTASGSVGTPFSYQIVASGLPTAFAASGLPTGLDVSASTGLISGTPQTVGTYQITLSATNAAGTATAALTLVVTPPAPTVLVVTPSVGGSVGQTFAYQIDATDSPTSFGASGLPAGLSIDATSGEISGTPTTTGAFTIGLTATNASGTGSGSFTLTIGPALPVIDIMATTASVPLHSGQDGVMTLSRTGDLSQQLWSITPSRERRSTERIMSR